MVTPEHDCSLARDAFRDQSNQGYHPACDGNVRRLYGLVSIHDKLICDLKPNRIVFCVFFQPKEIVRS